MIQPTIFSQRDRKWANDKMGKSGLTIHDYGCTITSLAMLLTAAVSGGTSTSYDVNKYQITYNRIVVSMRNADGTSNATTKTLVAPMSSGTTHTNVYNSGLFTYKNNGAHSATIGHMSLAAGGATTVNFYTSWYQGAWTGSSTFAIYMPYLMYEIE